MEKKRMLIILSTFILFLLIITLIIIKTGVMAKMFEIPVEKEITDEEYNEQRKKEKEEWKNNHQSNNSANLVSEDNTLLENELIDKYNEVENEVNAKGNKMDEIINRFYSEEYSLLSAQMIENMDKMSYNELCEQEYTQKIFDLIIDIIKNKDITEEEKNLLKEFLYNQYYFIENDSTIKLKFDEVLSNN